MNDAITALASSANMFHINNYKTNNYVPRKSRVYGSGIVQQKPRFKLN